VSAGAEVRNEELLEKIAEREWRKIRKRLGEFPSCPKCKSTKKVVPILYGLPPPHLEVMAWKGWVVLGGCIIHENNPNWYCKLCERGWK